MRRKHRGDGPRRALELRGLDCPGGHGAARGLASITAAEKKRAALRAQLFAGISPSPMDRVLQLLNPRLRAGGRYECGRGGEPVLWCCARV